MLTRLTTQLIVTAVTLLVAGMFLGNMLLIYMGVVPLVFIVISITRQQPTVVEVVRPTADIQIWADQAINISRGIKVSGGQGVVAVGEEIPEIFELVEGSNFKAFWKGPKDYEGTLSYKMKTTRRGVFHLKRTRWETRQTHQLNNIIKGEEIYNQTVYVRPRTFNVMKIRQQRTFSKMIMPSEALIKLGIPTTDFKEIRAYGYGDPYKNINWKASARSSSKNDQPKVNTYEDEGKKVVWIFMNTARRMALGRETSNSLEYAVQAVSGLTRFYLGRNCNVGFNIYSDDLILRSAAFTSRGTLTLPDLAPDRVPESKENLDPIKKNAEGFIIPDMGKRQELIITRRLLDVELGSAKYTLKQTVNKCRGHILGTNPLFVVVTSIDPSKKEQLWSGLMEMTKYTRRARTSHPTTLIINILGYGLAANSESDNMAAEILQTHDMKKLANLEGLGAALIQWDPSKHSFSEVLLSQVSRNQ